jgi:hypothetical protein
VPVHCRMRAFDRDLICGGHYGQRPVCRANRPNTWLHRPACKREENPCQLGAVHTWHTASETRALSLRQLNFASAPQDGAKTARTRIASFPMSGAAAPHDALIAPASQAKGVHGRSLPLTWEQAAHRGRVRRQTDAQRRSIKSDRPSGGTHFPTCATPAAHQPTKAHPRSISLDAQMG